jgi:hypothetical protein
VITVVVILNCNQSLIEELHKEIQRYGNTGKHKTQTDQKLESLSALVLILKKDSFLYYI